MGGASRPNKELAYGEQNLRPSAEWKPAFGGQYHRRFAPDYGRFAPEQRARLRRAKPSAFGRMETRLRRTITQALRAQTKSSPTASKTFGLRPNGNPPTAGNNTGASHPDKELAYGEQNVRPSAELKPAPC